MCPDRQLISLYVDGELPSPWREKLETHLTGCASCARAVESYRGISAELAAVPAEGLDEAKSRVWNAVSKRLAASSAPVPFRHTRRPLVLPIPAAVAALLVVAIAAAGGTGVALGSGRNAAKSEAVAVVEQPPTPAVPVSDMGSVLRYLDSQEGAGDILIIRLPEGSNFSSDGRPTLIRAADYNGRPLP